MDPYAIPLSELLFGILLSLNSVTSVIFNCFLIFFICVVDKRMLRKPINIYILSISVSDLLLAAVVTPLFAVTAFIRPHQVGPVIQLFRSCKVAILNFVLAEIACLNSIYTMVALAAERHRALVNPFKRPPFSIKHSIYTIFTIWSASIIYGISLTAFLFERFYHPSDLGATHASIPYPSSISGIPPNGGLLHSNFTNNYSRNFKASSKRWVSDNSVPLSTLIRIYGSDNIEGEGDFNGTARTFFNDVNGHLLHKYPVWGNKTEVGLTNRSKHSEREVDGITDHHNLVGDQSILPKLVKLKKVEGQLSSGLLVNFSNQALTDKGGPSSLHYLVTTSQIRYISPVLPNIPQSITNSSLPLPHAHANFPRSTLQQRKAKSCQFQVSELRPIYLIDVFVGYLIPLAVVAILYGKIMAALTNDTTHRNVGSGSSAGGPDEPVKIRISGGQGGGNAARKANVMNGGFKKMTVGRGITRFSNRRYSGPAGLNNTRGVERGKNVTQAISNPNDKCSNAIAKDWDKDLTPPLVHTTGASTIRNKVEGGNGCGVGGCVVHDVNYPSAKYRLYSSHRCRSLKTSTRRKSRFTSLVTRGATNMTLFRDGTSRQKRHAVLMILGIVILFALTWLPLHVVKLMEEFSHTQHFIHSRSARWLRKLCILIAMTSTWANVVVYFYFNENYKRNFISFFRRQCPATHKLFVRGRNGMVMSPAHLHQGAAKHPYPWGCTPLGPPKRSRKLFGSLGSRKMASIRDLISRKKTVLTPPSQAHYCENKRPTVLRSNKSLAQLWRKSL